MSVIFMHSDSNRILKKPKIFSCYVCSNTFTQMSNLRKHLRNIHRVQMNLRKKGTDYTCLVCSLTFSRKTNLKRHQVGIHKMNENQLEYSVRFLCNTCTAAFDDQPSLRAHRKSRHGENDCKIDNPFECGECGEFFQKKYELKKHLRYRHLPDSSNYHLLRSILPSMTNSINVIWYSVIDEERKHFKAKFTMSIKDKSEIEKWINEFQCKNKITLRKRSTHKTVKSNIVYHVKYGCHHNTKPKAGSNVSAKHTKCQASIALKLFALSRDIRNYAEVRLLHAHNHVLDSLEVLRFREPTEEVKEKFRNMFLNGMTPAQAIQQHKKDLEQQYGEEYQITLGDRGICPDKSWVYNYRGSCFKHKDKKTDDGDTNLNQFNDHSSLDDNSREISSSTNERSPSPEIVNLDCNSPELDCNFPLRNDRNVNIPVRNIIHIPYSGDISDVKIKNSKIVFSTVPTLKKISDYEPLKNVSSGSHSKVPDNKISSTKFPCSQLSLDENGKSITSFHKLSSNNLTSEMTLNFDNSALMEMDDVCIINISENEKSISDTVCSDDAFVPSNETEEEIMNVSTSFAEDNFTCNEIEIKDLFLEFDQMNEIIKEKAQQNRYLCEGIQQMVLNFRQNLQDLNRLNTAMFKFGTN